MRIDSPWNLYETKFKNELTEIEIDGEAALKKGILRPSLRIASNSLAVGGLLKCNLPKEKGYGFSKSSSEWIVKHECVKALSWDFCLSKSSDETLCYVKKKIVNPGRNKSIGIYFVWSGDKNELQIYKNDLVALKAEVAELSVRIFIVGPSNSKSLVSAELDRVVEYLEYNGDHGFRGKALGAKKAFIVSNACADRIAICHMRIRLNREFVEAVGSMNFDLATPRVETYSNGSVREYLSYFLVESYDAGTHIKREPLGAIDLTSNGSYLSACKGLVPFADGGCIVINRQALRRNPFYFPFDWGEAEDLGMAADAWAQGLWLDFWDHIIVKSSTCKVRYRKLPLSRLTDIKRRFFYLLPRIV